jgi:ribonuclease HI
MERNLEENNETLPWVQASHELLAVIEATTPVREALATGDYGTYFVAFTDGSCDQSVTSSPEGAGGWGMIVFGPLGERWEMHGGIEHTTSNRAEVCGLLAAVTCVPEGSALGVQSDSRYLVDRVRADCRANDNLDLWCEVREMLVAKSIRLSAAWVPGHSGIRHNERVDKLASGRGRSNGRRTAAVGGRRRVAAAYG